MISNGSFWANQTNGLINDLIGSAKIKSEKRNQESTLRKFFPDDVSSLIMTLPDNQRWDAIQQLAPHYGLSDQGSIQNEESQVADSLTQQGIQTGPMGQDLLAQLMNPSQQTQKRVPVKPPVTKPPIKSQGLSYTDVATRKLMNGTPPQEQVAPRSSLVNKAHLGKELKKEDFKQAYEYAEDITGIGRASKQGLAEAKRMEKLNNSGKLSPALWSSAVKLIGAGGYGPDLTSLLSPESVEFDKIATGFLKNAKNYFGSRMTEGEVNLFLRTVPSLLQSKKGRERLIHNMQNMFEAGNIRAQAFHEIKKELGGRTPANIEALVEEAVGPQIDKLHSDFIEGTKSNPGQKEYIAGKVYTNSKGEKAVGVAKNGTVILERL